MRQELKLGRGILTEVRIVFPPGCAGLVHCRLLHQAHQLAPTNPEGDFSGDTYPQVYSEYFELFATPYLLVLEAWNDDDTFAHTIYLSLTVLPESVVRAASEDLSLIGRLLRRLMGL